MTATMTRPQTRTGNRTEALHEMLTRYHEARAESAGIGGGGTHNESRINSFDLKTWTKEYKELERCLTALRALAYGRKPMIEKNVSSGAAWWHIRARYLEATVARREVHLRKTHSGERIPARLPRNCEVVARATILNGKTNHMLVRTWDSRVDPLVVAAGLRWISREFKGSPSVYRETD